MLPFLLKHSIFKLDSFFTKLLLLGFLLLFILFPSSFVLIFLLKHSSEIVSFLSLPSRLYLITGALVFSLKIAALVAFVDLVFGLPFAWLLTRSQFPGSRLLENISSLPLALPTSALGFSAAIFWSFTNIPLSAFWFLVLVHLSFTFPFAVGILGTALKRETGSLEQAATILGAPKLTVIRTVILPQIKPELITAMFFCFARSLSETGATIVALTVFGVTKATAPVLVAQLGNGESAQITPDEKMLLAAIISGILIFISISLFSLLHTIMKNKSFPLLPKMAHLETKLNSSFFIRLKNIILFSFFIFVILIPPFFILNRVLGVRTFDFSSLAVNLFNSLFIALCVTIVNLLMGVPMAYFLVHSGSKRLCNLMNFLVDIPLIIPTVALGFSLGLYWKNYGFIVPDMLLIVMAHLAFTYPYVVRTLRDAFIGLSNEFIDASRGFGAPPIMVLRSIILPLLAPAFVTAAVLVATRSLSETGATMAVTKNAVTAPVYIVNLVNNQQLEQAGIASALLIILTFAMFTLLRRSAFVKR